MKEVGQCATKSSVRGTLPLTAKGSTPSLSSVGCNAGLWRERLRLLVQKVENMKKGRQIIVESDQ
jgi:hypothetical protein